MLWRLLFAYAAITSLNWRRRRFQRAGRSQPEPPIAIRAVQAASLPVLGLVVAWVIAGVWDWQAALIVATVPGAATYLLQMLSGLPKIMNTHWAESSPDAKIRGSSGESGL